MLDLKLNIIWAPFTSNFDQEVKSKNKGGPAFDFNSYSSFGEGMTRKSVNHNIKTNGLMACQAGDARFQYLAFTSRQDVVPACHVPRIHGCCLMQHMTPLPVLLFAYCCPFTSELRSSLQVYYTPGIMISIADCFNYSLLFHILCICMMVLMMNCKCHS